MTAVAPPMISSVMRNAYLRPTRSPMRPKNKAPNGRTMNPTAKVDKVCEIRQSVVSLRIEERGDYRGETSEDIEVVPLDHRSDGGRCNNLPDSCSHGGGS